MAIKATEDIIMEETEITIKTKIEEIGIIMAAAVAATIVDRAEAAIMATAVMAIGATETAMEIEMEASDREETTGDREETETMETAITKQRNQTVADAVALL